MGGRRLMTLVTTVVLARLLSPTDFGLVAMAAIFIGFADLVRDMGTGAGIVQTDAPTADLLSSVFWLNLGLGVLLTALLIVLAPVVAVLLREPRLTPVLRTLSVSMLFAAAGVVHTSMLTRELRFRQLAVVELCSALAGSILGVALALKGYGVWSLIGQSVCTVVMVSGGTWLASEWRPRFVFDAASLRSILGFSANLTGFNAFNYFARNADNLLIGRYLGTQNLGFYDLAYRVMLYPLQMISWALGRALFPVYARLRAEPARLAAAYLKVTRGVALIAFPVIFGILSIAHPFVETALGPAWSPVVPLLLILGPLSALQAIGTTVGYVYQATGRTDLLFAWGIGAGLLLITSFAVGLHWGIIGVAVCYSIVSYALAYHLFKIPLSLIGLRVSDVAEAVGRPLLCAGGMLLVVFVLKRVIPSAIDGALALGVLVSVGIVVYVSATWMWNRESAFEVLTLAKRVS
jgi:O-antigen/teichoic acid export membrane protein